MSLLYPNSSIIHPVARDYFARINSAGGDVYDKKRVNDFIKILNDTVNWNDVKCYLLRSTQNIGSGTVVYTVGGWSNSNNNLINSPTWTTRGIDLNGTNQYGVDVGDIWNGGTALTLLVDINQDNLGGLRPIVGFWDQTGNQRGFLLATSLGAYVNYQSANGASTSQITFGSATIGQNTTVGIVFNGSYTFTFINGTPTSASGTTSASIFNTSAPTTIGSFDPTSPTSFFDGVISCVLFIKSAISASQLSILNNAMIALR